jgi:hypothetical protein
MDLEKAAEPTKKIPDGNSMDNEQYVFEIEYRGKTATLTNKILNQNEKTNAACIAARMRDGLPYEAFEPARASVISCMAHLYVSIVDKPDWLDWGNAIDDSLIMRVWEVVLQHENQFRRSRQDQGVGG